MYRINLGNGQVWTPVGTHSLATLRAMAKRLTGSAFVERYEVGSADEPGEWWSA